ncbi:vesicle transport through interaction with t-SNAREs homolog 1A isoform X2 [Urocitellus parryii]|uniref:Vesicle transport through interaction with t-SNAREs 1A n=1 Tax=Urocitellus parryii TaxID=9999 RepID=A0A8D2KPQ3_UROPR|nr:vesicle transport through interaction with t-SNAREs homolog 1A isoform X2 [Urocitellus parryii]
MFLCAFVGTLFGTYVLGEFLNLEARPDYKTRTQPNFRRTEIAKNNQEAAGLGAVPGSPLCFRGCLQGSLSRGPPTGPRLRPRSITPELPCHPISKAMSRTSRCSLQRSPARFRGSPDSRLLEQMDLEVREIPPQSRGMYSNRMRSYKQEMGKLETDFKRSRIAYSDEVRNELLGDDGNSSENQRAHLLDNTERLERSSRRLEAGYQIAVETEQIGQEMLENLSHDREKIQRARERLRETDANLGKSSRILTGMLRRIIQNRILLVLLGIIVVVTILTAVTFFVRGH